jgi:hypothetical protein
MATMELMDEIQAEDDIYELTPEEERLLDEADKEPCISAKEANRRHRECLEKLTKKLA